MAGISNAVIFNEVKNIKEIVTSLNKCVVTGNGKPPLMERMTIVENCIEEQKKEREKRGDFKTKTTLLIIGMIVTNIGMIVFSYWK